MECNIKFNESYELIKRGVKEIHCTPKTGGKDIIYIPKDVNFSRTYSKGIEGAIISFRAYASVDFIEQMDLSLNHGLPVGGDGCVPIEERFVKNITFDEKNILFSMDGDRYYLSYRIILK